MRINHNISAMHTSRQMGLNTSAVESSMEKLSSGLRINRASDDAAGLSVSEKMRSMLRGLDSAVRNTQDGVSYIQTAEGALTEVSSMLLRMKELTVQKANGTYDADDIADADLELNQLNEEINSIYANTVFNGKNVFEEVDFAINHDGTQTVSLAAATTTLSAAVDETSSAEDIDDAIREVNTQRATYGAMQNRLEHTLNNLGVTQENLQSAESRIRDTDMATEMAELTKNNILNQAAQAMLAQANQLPQNVLQLLQ